MKFSKKMMAVAVLASTQAVVLFGLPPTRGAATGAKRPVETARPLSKAPAFNEQYEGYLNTIRIFLNTPEDRLSGELVDEASRAWRSLSQFFESKMDVYFEQQSKPSEQSQLDNQFSSEALGSQDVLEIEQAIRGLSGELTKNNNLKPDDEFTKSLNDWKNNITKKINEVDLTNNQKDRLKMVLDGNTKDFIKTYELSLNPNAQVNIRLAKKAIITVIDNKK